MRDYTATDTFQKEVFDVLPEVAGPAIAAFLGSSRSLERLSSEDLLEILEQLGTLHQAVLRRLRRSREEPVRDAGDEVLLTVEEAAEKLRMSRDWVYRNAQNLPFTRRVGRRSLRFSGAGIDDWLRARGGR